MQPLTLCKVKSKGEQMLANSETQFARLWLSHGSGYVVAGDKAFVGGVCLLCLIPQP